jgi:pSer/pThr/pTyr-binding forkhead associated (FHA) protein
MGLRLTVFSAWSQKTENEISYQFDQGRIVLGRGAGSDVRLPDRTVSETHAFIRLEGSDYVILDNGSTNGTVVNGARIVSGRPKIVRNGDLIGIGEYVLSVQTGVSVTVPTSAERTAALARRLVREIRVPSAPDLSPPRLTVLNGEQAGQFCEIPRAPARLIVGRARSCQFFINDPDVSREHMEVIRDLDGVLVRNLDSKNGLIVADQRISAIRLKNAVELILGTTKLRFEEPADESILALSSQPDLPAPKTPGTIYERSDASQIAGGGLAGKAPARVEMPIRGATKSPRRFSLEITDLVVYLLAAIVTVLSIGGLIILLSSG